MRTKSCSLRSNSDENVTSHGHAVVNHRCLNIELITFDVALLNPCAMSRVQMTGRAFFGSTTNPSDSRQTALVQGRHSCRQIDPSWRNDHGNCEQCNVDASDAIETTKYGVNSPGGDTINPCSWFDHPCRWSILAEMVMCDVLE